MSNDLERRRQERRDAVRAALRRVTQPHIFSAKPERPRLKRRNADVAWQDARQKLRLPVIGFCWSWLTKQLARREYRSYTKGIVHHWYDR